MKKLLYTLIFVYMNVSATNYYVKTGGNDEADGLSDGTAWATLEKVTAFQASLMPGDSVLFKCGDTFRGNMILNMAGTVDSRIVYGAYGSGEKPIITGFETLTEWTDAGGGIYSKAVVCASKPNYIVINNKWYAMGRYPNEELLTYESFSSNVSITDNELTGDPNWTGAEAVIRKNSWTWDRCLISAHTDQTLAYTNLGSTSGSTANYGYFIQNDIKTLDEFGEWYYDDSLMHVYFGAVNPNDYTVNVPTINNLIYSWRKSYITVENLQFIGAGRSSVFMESFADFCVIQNCDFNFSGEHGLKLTTTRNIIVDNNTLTNVVKAGIFMDSSRDAIVTNNTITNTSTLLGAWLLSSTEIAALVCVNNALSATGTVGALIQYNKIDGSGYHGIRFTGNTVEVKNNLIKNSALLLNDGAGIHSIGATHVNRLIEENIILNVVGNTSGTTATPAADGIFLNNVTAGNIINNTIAHCGSNGYRFGNIIDVNIAGNMAYDNLSSIIFLTATSTGNSMYDNTFVAKSANQTTLSVGFDFSTAAKFVNAYGNYYVRPKDNNEHMRFYESGGWVNKTLADWQTQSGEDADAKGSPIEITDESMFRFYYNPTDEDAVFELDERMIDMDGIEVADSVTLLPWSSVVLLVDTTYVGIRKDMKSENGLSVYPNPATSQLWIKVAEMNQDRFNFTIMDIQGKVVVKGQLGGISNGAYPIDISNLSSGIYLIRVEGMDAKGYNERVIIRR